MDTIILNIKEVYGKKFLYPKTHAKELGQLTGKKTLDENDIKSLQALGFKVKVELDQEAIAFITKLSYR